jgi:ABC-type uncharacterized transport system permease subunit
VITRCKLLAASHAVMGANALAGARYALGGAPGVPSEWLRGTPFDDYRVPGAILGGAVGGTQAAATIALLRGDRHASRLSQVASGVLLAWILIQLRMIGYRSPLQPADREPARVHAQPCVGAGARPGGPARSRAVTAASTT